MEIYITKLKYDYGKIIKRTFKNPIIKPKDGIHIYQISIYRSFVSNIHEDYSIFVKDIIKKNTIYSFDIHVGLTIDDRILVKAIQYKSFLELHKIVEFVLEKCLNIYYYIFKLRYQVYDSSLYVNIFKANSKIIMLNCYDGGHQIGRIELTSSYRNKLKLFKMDKNAMMKEKKYIYLINAFGDISIDKEYADNPKAITLVHINRYKIQECFRYIQFNPLDYDIV